MTEKMLILRSNLKKMRLASCLFLFVICCIACSQNSKQEERTAFGKTIDTSGTKFVNEWFATLNGKDSDVCRIKGKIKDVCQAEGCWMNLELPEGKSLLVRMRDHEFTVPKYLSGFNAYISGTAHLDTTSVELLQDYAKDAGQTQDQIDSITEPKIDWVVEADGVMLAN